MELGKTSEKPIIITRNEGEDFYVRGMRHVQFTVTRHVPGFSGTDDEPQPARTDDDRF
jgi:hypothetical protein